MLKVLAVVPSSFCFGLQNVTLSFFSKLSAEVSPHFLVTRWTDGEFAKRLEELRIPYDSSWLGMFSRKLDWYNLKMTLHCGSKLPQLYRDYLKVVRSFKPDLIYTANHHELLLLLPLLKVMNIPVVCHVHDPPPSAPFYRGVYRMVDGLTDRFIAISDSVSARTQQLGISSKKVIRLHNGIDLSELPFSGSRSRLFQQKYGWPDDSVIVGITGQILEQKGHEDLLEAMRVVTKRNKHVRLVIGGRLQGTYFDKLARQVAETELAQVVGFSEWQPRATDFFSGLDIFVLASKHDEGFGLVVGEAMATGLPVIATASGGASELLVDGKTGLLVNKSDPTHLAEAILRLSGSEDLRKSMGRKGRKHVEGCFDITTQAQLLTDILIDVASRKT